MIHSLIGLWRLFTACGSCNEPYTIKPPTGVASPMPKESVPSDLQAILDSANEGLKADRYCGDLLPGNGSESIGVRQDCYRQMISGCENLKGYDRRDCFREIKGNQFGIPDRTDVVFWYPGSLQEKGPSGILVKGRTDTLRSDFCNGYDITVEIPVTNLKKKDGIWEGYFSENHTLACIAQDELFPASDMEGIQRLKRWHTPEKEKSP